MTAKEATPPPENDKPSKVFTSLQSDLESHNNFFDDVVDMFPAKLYVKAPTGDEVYNPKYKKGIHAESKDARRHRNKLEKLAKFDPSKAETTLETKRRKDRENDDDSQPKFRGDISSSKPDDDDDDGDTALITPPGTSRIEILRAKLHAKIKLAQGNRPTRENGLISKRGARKAAKQEIINAAIKKRKAEGLPTYTPGSKPWEKNGGLGYSAVVDKSKKAKFSKDAATTEKKNDASVADDMAGIEYGDIAGLKQIDQRFDNKSLNPVKKKKSLEKLLEDAQRKRQRLKELKESTSEVDHDKASAIEWSDTFMVADGRRVRDDTEAIKKAMRRKDKKKEKSQKAWKARTKEVDNKISGKQAIREHNLGARKKGGVVGANLSSKRIKDIDPTTGEERKEVGTDGKEKKKGRSGPHAVGKGGRAGFEGKKQDFINKSGGNKGK